MVFAELAIGAVRERVQQGLVMLLGRFVAQAQGGHALGTEYQLRMGVWA